MTPEQRASCKVVDSPERTMLGARQEAWLDVSLNNQARWNFVAQQVMMMPYDARKDGDTARPQNGGDNWNGYPAARRRFTDMVLQHRLKNVVVGSGDLHQSVVGYIPTNPDDPSAPPLVSEFLATSITSGGTGGLRHPNELTVLDNNPNVSLLNNQRGFHLYTISDRQWLAEIKVLDQVDRPQGQLSVLARYIVDPKAPGPMPA
jgi:alkaline phosphatase D